MSDRDQSSHKVAKLLVEKSRAEEAVAILAAWAASGPNDGPGQELLAEALRLDPGSALAKMAFQRMEGLPGDQALLDGPSPTFDAKALGEIEKQYRRPRFQQGAAGVQQQRAVQRRDLPRSNRRLRHRSAAHHHASLCGRRRVIKSHKRKYPNELKREDVAGYVRS